MSNQTTHFSFRRLLETGDGKYTNYVLSDLRHQGLVDFLDRKLDGSGRQHALDVGCGSGAVTRGLAKLFAHVHGIDGNPDNVALAASLTKDAGFENISYAPGAATQLPVESASMDAVILNGVLEWVGLNDKGERPQHLQAQTLRECARVLRSGGVLYVAIENRWHPRSLLRDPHTHLPLVNALPRPLADLVSKGMQKRPFQAYIYGVRKLKKMLRHAGFDRVEAFVPFPGYQYAASFASLDSRAASLSDAARIDPRAVQATLDRVGQSNVDAAKATRRLHRRARWGLLRLMAHDLALLATKP